MFINNDDDDDDDDDDGDDDDDDDDNNNNNNNNRDPETGSDVWLLLAASWRHGGDQHKGDCTTSCC